jgi:hypothetical protein
VRAPRSRAVDRLLGWIGPLGRGPASWSASLTWQATMPRTIALGRFPAQYCA